jgi:hypothetical protein
MKRPINKPLAMLLLRPSTLTISNSNARALPTERYLAPPDPRTLQPTDRLIVVYHRIMNISWKNAFHFHPPRKSRAIGGAFQSDVCGTGPGFSASYLNAGAADVVAWSPMDGSRRAPLVSGMRESGRRIMSWNSCADRPTY